MRTLCKFLFAMLLFAVLCFGLATHAQAAPAPQAQPAPTIPATSSDKEGCGCHSAENASWQASPHGQMTTEGKPAATCETCHGKYVEGHPDKGMIPLDVDSSACTNCHKQTATEWQGTIHAKAGIQCISCHVSHTQDLRVSSDKLCQSCHRESLKDPLHTAHWVASTSCTSCHLSGNEVHPVTTAATNIDPKVVLAATPRHDFVTVSANKCLDCHRNDVTAKTGPAQAGANARQELIAAAEQLPTLRAELTGAQQTTRTLALWQPVVLGAGISIGGILGIAFVLAVIRFSRSKRGDEQ